MLLLLQKQPFLHSPYTFLSPYLQKLDDIKDQLSSSMQQILSQHKLKLESLQKQKNALRPDFQIATLKKSFSEKKLQIHQTVARQINRRKQHLDSLSRHLKAIDPRNLLQKGYSIVFREKKDSVILSKGDVAPGENLRITLSDGKILVTVKEKS